MKRFKIFVWVVMGILISALLFWIFSHGVMRAQRASARTARARLAALETRRDSLRKTEAQKEAWEQVPAELERFNQGTIPSFDEFPDFRNQLQRRISGSGLTTLKFTYSMRPVQNRLQRVTLEFSLSGPYAAIKRFVYQTEQQKEMVYLKSIQMRKTREGIISNFSMEAFFER